MPNARFTLNTTDAESQAVTVRFDPQPQPLAAGARYMTNPQPTQRVRDETGAPVDHNLDAACLYHIQVTQYGSTVPIQLALRLNYAHRTVARLQETAEHDAMLAAAAGGGSGFVRGAFAHLKPADGIQDVNYVALHQAEFGYLGKRACARALVYADARGKLEPHFIETMALVNERNFEHGIVAIPHEVCWRARLPVWRGTWPEPPTKDVVQAVRAMGHVNLESDAAKEAAAKWVEAWKQSLAEKYKDWKHVRMYYAVPVNHVAVWPYASLQYRNEGGHVVEEFRYEAPDGSWSRCTTWCQTWRWRGCARWCAAVG